MNAAVGVQPNRARVLVEGLEKLPSHPPVALRVLWLAEDPRSSVPQLAAAISADQSLTARMMRMANSPYYGLSGRISSASFAITVLGFRTVTAIAAAAAAGAAADAKKLPEGFWAHAARTAAGASLVAPRLKVEKHEAFSVGILHDVGRALLHAADAPTSRAVSARVTSGEAVVDVEREVFDIDHTEAAAVVLASWRFPDPFVEAIRTHHDPLDTSAAGAGLAVALAVGRCLADLIEPGRDPVPEATREAAFDAAGVSAETAAAFADVVAREADGLAAALNS